MHTELYPDIHPRSLASIFILQTLYISLDPDRDATAAKGESEYILVHVTNRAKGNATSDLLAWRH